MDQRSRMIRMLGCLAAAMTACSALLFWIRPADPATATLSDPDFARNQASVAVELGQGVHLERWRQVHLVPAPSSALMALMAGANGGELHFVVSDLGVIHAVGAWRDQRTHRGFPGGIVIGVDGMASEGGLTAAQKAALQALLFELSQRCDCDLPVQVGRSLAGDVEDWGLVRRTRPAGCGRAYL